MKYFFITLFFLASYSSLFAQPFPLLEPEESQACTVTQQLGLSVISLSYNSPLTRGRRIFGGLVPHGKVWRAGANENTLISVTDDVLVNGYLLPAGTYGLHMIPSEKEWVVIFSKNKDAWGSYFYDEKDDALRIKVNPEKALVQNWLSYNFLEPKAKDVVLQLHWDDVAISFIIQINKLEQVVVESMQNELTTRDGFFWQGYAQAASYCIRNKVSLDQAEFWINKSIVLKRNYSNVSIKANLFKLLNRLDSAQLLRLQARSLIIEELSIASENEINTAAYGYLAAKDYEQAIKLFELNVLKFPNSWNVYDGLGEALILAGKKAEGKKNYRKALSKVLPEDQRLRIQDLLKQ